MKATTKKTLAQSKHDVKYIALVLTLCVIARNEKEARSAEATAVV